MENPEVRFVLVGRTGQLLARSRPSPTKIDMVSISSSVQPGQHVLAERIRELERANIYYCETIEPDRMIVLVTLTAESTVLNRLYHGDEQRTAVGLTMFEFKDLVELSTVHDPIFYREGRRNITTRCLIKIDCEEKVYQMFDPRFRRPGVDIRVEYLPCGHTGMMPFDELMEKRGNQPLDPNRLSAPARPSVECPQCIQDRELTESRTRRFTTL